MQLQEELNPQQLAAVSHVEGPLLVIAGAGSGKTRIVTTRVVHLLQLGVPAASILAVTFTNKAAEEMRHRIQKLAKSSILACTFHSLCARILRESITALGYKPNFVIFDEEDSEKTIKECLALLNEKEEKGLVKQQRLLISQAKNNLQEPDDVSKEDPLFCAVYKQYYAKLKEYNALDFDDLLFLSVKLFREFPEILESYQKRWRFILIDEYQDTNAAQYTLIKLLSQRHHNVFAVGDPDQSIYSWRGANIHNILNFEKDYPGAKIVSLEQNYRSTSIILKAANALIKHNESRFEKNLWSDKGEGQKIGLYICENERAEADFVVRRLIKQSEEKEISFADCAIFYRTHSQSRTFEDALLRRRIPYLIVGGLSFYQRREIKDLLALMRVVLGSPDSLSVIRTINLPKRGIGEGALEKLRAFAQIEKEDLFSSCAAIALQQKSFKLSKKQEEGLREYVTAILFLREQMAHLPLHELLSLAVERTRYLDHLKDDPDSFEERRDNLQELISKAAEWEDEVSEPHLALFLEELSLKSSADEKAPQEECVRLMTLHNGKGLEYNTVFLVGMEEDLFPHANSRESPENLEEERRLCYVGMTRAKETLYLTASRFRFLWGTPHIMRPSRFLKEIPPEYLEAFHESRADYSEEAAEPSERFLDGASVFHPDFGMGTIERSYSTSLGLTYDVYFPHLDRVRSLVAKYAQLRAAPEET
jgi:DNA helicase II / ATP-dependent DNA helicase PcrA